MLSTVFKKSINRRMLGAVRTSVQPMQQVRHLNIHEYQSKQLMEKYGIRTQRNVVVGAEEGASAIAPAFDKLGAVDEYVVKAQVHAGGRGKGTFANGFQGGVHVTADATKAKDIAEKMLGVALVTKQTPPDGVVVRKVMIAEAVDIGHEYYFAILMDRASLGPVIVASREGGVDIEEVAEKNPSAIVKLNVSIEDGLSMDQARELAKKLQFKEVDDAAEQMCRLYKLFIESDATQVEVNPLIELPDNKVLAMDAKISFDDNAEFRQKEIFAMRDSAEEDPREVAAAAHNLNYIGMDGNIGCLVNGAGLAMATMDIIQLYGGKPANFLDVGGSASAQQITEAFKILTADPQVKAILVNIFGGIMKCDVIAEGVVAAAQQLDLKVPVIVRLEGTNSALSKDILAQSGMALISATDLHDAAEKAVKTLQ